jgi:hypothetical protein
MIVAAQPAGGRRWREADNDTVSNDGDRDQKESEVTVLLYYLFSFPLSFFIPCFFLSGFKNNLLVLVFFFLFAPSLLLFSILSLFQNFCPPPQNLLSSSFVSPSSLCLSSKSCPPSISGSPPVFIGSRGEGHPTLSKRRVRWRGAAFA